ncbi:MAG TPA: hypothetical protein P5531_13150 [Bacteroidales bacterium]|nr:hypothetical protein [Bacteroidales bacterium]HSA44482.1 hypothetical protein [Bacteroidales bacterium]
MKKFTFMVGVLFILLLPRPGISQKSVESGYVFISGNYIDAPYHIVARDLSVFINGFEVCQPLVFPPESDYRYTQFPGIPPGISEITPFSALKDILEPEKGNNYLLANQYYYLTNFPYKAAIANYKAFLATLPNVKAVTDFDDDMVQIACYTGEPFLFEVSDMTARMINEIWGPAGKREGYLDELVSLNRERVERIARRLEMGELFIFLPYGIEISYAGLKSAWLVNQLVSLAESTPGNLLGDKLIEAGLFPASYTKQLAKFVEEFRVTDGLRQRVRAIPQNLLQQYKPPVKKEKGTSTGQVGPQGAFPDNGATAHSPSGMVFYAACPYTNEPAFQLFGTEYPVIWDEIKDLDVYSAVEVFSDLYHLDDIEVGDNNYTYNNLVDLKYGDILYYTSHGQHTGLVMGFFQNEANVLPWFNNDNTNVTSYPRPAGNFGARVAPAWATNQWLPTFTQYKSVVILACCYSHFNGWVDATAGGVSYGYDEKTSTKCGNQNHKEVLQLMNGKLKNGLYRKAGEAYDNMTGHLDKFRVKPTDAAITLCPASNSYYYPKNEWVPAEGAGSYDIDTYCSGAVPVNTAIDETVTVGPGENVDVDAYAWNPAAKPDKINFEWEGTDWWWVDMDVNSPVIKSWDPLNFNDHQLDFNRTTPNDETGEYYFYHNNLFDWFLMGDTGLIGNWEGWVYGGGKEPFVETQTGTIGWVKLSVWDTFGDTLIDSIYVYPTYPSRPLTIGFQIIPCSAPDKADGSIFLIYDAACEYSFIWSNGATTPFVTDLEVGRYHVTVTCLSCPNDDPYNGNCYETTTQHVTMGFDPLRVKIESFINPSCNGDSDGEISITVTGGHFPYTYEWTRNGAYWGNTDNITACPAGLYRVEVTDDEGNVRFAEQYLSEPLDFVFDLHDEWHHITCFGDGDGLLDAEFSGGNPPYVCTWSNGSTGLVINNLQEDTYVLTVIDSKGCTGSDTWDIIEPDPVDAVIISNDPYCNTFNDGSIVITPSGGWPPINAATGQGPVTYTVIIDCDDGFHFESDPFTVNFQLTDCGPGVYTITVLDPEACDYTATVVLTYIVEISCVPTVTSPSCFGGSDGEISLSCSGGTGPYTYQWSDGSTAATRSGLSSGQYNVTVTDDDGCTATASIDLSEPSDFDIGIFSLNPTCFNWFDGLISLTVGGATPPYLYTWSNGGIGSLQAGLPAGDYSVTVSDANSCVTTRQITLTQPDEIQLNISILQAPVCPNNNNGVIEVSATGGNGGFTYTWNNGFTGALQSSLVPGTYSITATDMLGCTGTGSIELSGTQISVSISSDPDPPDICQGNSIILTASGALTYEWSNGLGAGESVTVSPDISTTYSVTGTDVNGCTGTASISINVNSNPLVNAGPDLVINQGQSIVINATVTGGTPAYVFSWTPVDGLDNPSLLNPNASPSQTTFYMLNVTDMNGCEEADQMLITVTGIPQSVLTGTVSYDNDLQTPLNDVTIQLLLNSILINTTTTSNTGQYIFDDLENGTYTLNSSTEKPWGGVNASDALLILRCFVGLGCPSGLKYLAADANCNGYINSADALSCMKRFVGLIPILPCPEWIFESDQVEISGVSTYNYDYQGICLCDVNGTYVPALKQRPLVRLEEAGSIEASLGQLVNIPLTVKEDMMIGSITLTLLHDPSISIINVLPAVQNQDGFLFNDRQGILKIVWYSLVPMRLNAGDRILTLQLELQNATIGNPLFYPDDESVLSDDKGILYPETVIQIPTLIFQNYEFSLGNNIPNPFNKTTEISFYMPTDGKVSLQVSNILGEVVSEIIKDEGMKSGQHRLLFDCTSCPQGIYFMELEIKGLTSSFRQSKKIIITK